MTWRKHVETSSLPVIGAWGLDQLIRIEVSRTSSTECWAGVSGAEARKSIINVVFWMNKINRASSWDYCQDKEEEKDSPTCGLGGAQNDFWLSLIWDLVDVNIVPASWQEVADGDRGGGARNIWRCRPWEHMPLYLFRVWNNFVPFIPQKLILQTR